jgi:DNA replication licensing factor MCM6
MSRFDLFFVLLDECNEVTDYNIARHLVSVHQRTDEAVSPEFTTGQLKRYIKYAKCFFPRLGEDAQKLLVSQFRQLRLDDASGASTNGKTGAWRITVRQLESMIRLSEALARLYCEDEVKPKHVKEAFRLLQTSIIRIENEDIDLDELETREPVQVPTPSEDQEMTDAAVPADSSSAESALAAKKKYSITHDKFIKMKNMMALHLSRVGEDEDGIKHNDLVQWYLEQIEDELQSVEQLEEAKALAERVVKKCRKVSCGGVVLCTLN